MQGVLSAKVVLVMYGDYQCSRSADVYKLIKGIKQELSASLRGLLYLPSFSASIPMLNGSPAEAAAVQGQFWSMHDTLFIHQQQLENGYLVEYANDLGLDILISKSCLNKCMLIASMKISKVDARVE